MEKISLEEMKYKIDEMHKAFFGNGKPGLYREHIEMKAILRTIVWVFGSGFIGTLFLIIERFKG